MYRSLAQDLIQRAGKQRLSSDSLKRLLAAGAFSGSPAILTVCVCFASLLKAHRSADIAIYYLLILGSPHAWETSTILGSLCTNSRDPKSLSPHKWGRVRYSHVMSCRRYALNAIKNKIKKKKKNWEHLVFHLVFFFSTLLLFFNPGNLKYLYFNLGQADFQPCHRTFWLSTLEANG